MMTSSTSSANTFMKLMRRYWKYGALGAGAVVVLGLIVLRIFFGNAGQENRRPASPLVKVEKPTLENITYTLRYTGNVAAAQQATIYSKVSGTLERVFVDMGAAVRLGQMLALIDTTELYQQYQQASATYQNAQLNFRRTKELFEQNLVAKQDLDNADAAAKIARANFETAGTRLGYARITAPFSGYITKRFLDPGALVATTNASLFTLMDLDNLKIVINVREKDIPQVALGRRATITVDAFPDKEFAGVITRYSEAVDLPTRTMGVEIDIANREHILKPGMFANVTLDIGQRKGAITVPTVALLKDDKGYYLYTVVTDTAHRVRTDIGTEQNNRTEILSTLDTSATIITTGQQFVRDHGLVTIQQ
jgi:membrane fusion protein (multidrug efflux system)